MKWRHAISRSVSLRDKQICLIPSSRPRTLAYLIYIHAQPTRRQALNSRQASKRRQVIHDACAYTRVARHIPKLTLIAATPHRLSDSHLVLADRMAAYPLHLRPKLLFLSIRAFRFACAPANRNQRYFRLHKLRSLLLAAMSNQNSSLPMWIASVPAATGRCSEHLRSEHSPLLLPSINISMLS